MADDSDNTRPSASAPAPTMTSMLRVSDQRVSQRQIGIVVGLVILIAGGVWGAATVVYGNQADTIETLHVAEVERLQAQLQASEERHIATEERSRAVCDERINDFKETLTSTQTSLQMCLERGSPPPD